MAYSVSRVLNCGPLALYGSGGPGAGVGAELDLFPGGFSMPCGLQTLNTKTLVVEVQISWYHRTLLNLKELGSLRTFTWQKTRS